jgi:ribosomal protein L37AE/L43A
VTRTAADLEYQDWTAGVFANRLTPRGVAVRDVPDARTGKTYRSAVLRTRSDPSLTEAHRRWYPAGRKHVPANLALTALTVAVWLADDGSVTAASRRSPDVKFATQGFAAPEVEQLAGLLSARYPGDVKVYVEAGSGQRTIRMFGEQAKALLRDVDPVFPPLGRKSRRWRATELLVDKAATPQCPRCAHDHVYRWAKTSGGVQKFKCQGCMRVFLEEYERPWRDPSSTWRASA